VVKSFQNLCALYGQNIDQLDHNMVDPNITKQNCQSNTPVIKVTELLSTAGTRIGSLSEV
jgi:hypothetical protein